MRKGSSLIVAMLFVAIFGTFAVAVSQIAATNIQIASSQAQANRAHQALESGLDIIRCLLSDLSYSDTGTINGNFANLASALQARLADINLGLASAYTASAINLTSPSLDDASAQYFTARITPVDINTVAVLATGFSSGLSRQACLSYVVCRAKYKAFNSGIASREGVSMVGNARLQGRNSPSEADIYIEKSFNTKALSMTGNAIIAGEVKINQPDAWADLTGNISIADASGQDAYRHITVNSDLVDLPVPTPLEFEHYAATTISSKNVSGNKTLKNIRIAANSDTSFSGNIKLEGIVYIEQPNIITFSGNLTVEGVIVAAGDYQNPSLSNYIKFAGNTSISAPTDRAKYGDLVDKTGTFLLAPGFAVEFVGNVGTVHGSLAANGIVCKGNSGGTIKGSLINYGSKDFYDGVTEYMTLTGNDHWIFDHSNMPDFPSGFAYKLCLAPCPTSYQELP